MKQCRPEMSLFGTHSLLRWGRWGQSQARSVFRPFSDYGPLVLVEGVLTGTVLEAPRKALVFCGTFDFAEGECYVCRKDKLAPDGLMSQGESRSGV